MSLLKTNMNAPQKFLFKSFSSMAAVVLLLLCVNLTVWPIVSQTLWAITCTIAGAVAHVLTRAWATLPDYLALLLGAAGILWTVQLARQETLFSNATYDVTCGGIIALGGFAYSLILDDIVQRSQSSFMYAITFYAAVWVSTFPWALMHAQAKLNSGKNILYPAGCVTFLALTLSATLYMTSHNPGTSFAMTLTPLVLHLAVVLDSFFRASRFLKRHNEHWSAAES